MAFVQAFKGQPASGATIATGAVSTTSGNCLCIIAVWRSATGGAFVSIADTAGNTWVQHANSPKVTTPAGDQTSVCYYAQNITGNAANVVTVTTTTSSTTPSIVGAEFSGRLTSSAVEGMAYSSDANTTSHVGPFTGATTAGSDLVTLAAGDADTGTGGPYTATNGWTVPANGSNNGGWPSVVLYLNAGGGASANATWTSTTSGISANYVLAFKSLLPFISAQPTQQSEVSGSTATFSVTASGPTASSSLVGQQGTGWTLTNSLVQQTGGNAVYYASGYTATAGVATHVYFYAEGATSATVVKFAVYNAAGSLVGVTSSVDITGIGLVSAPFATPVTLTAQVYKIVVVPASGYLYFAANSGSSGFSVNQNLAANFSYASPPSTLPAADSAGNGQEFIVWLGTPVTYQWNSSPTSQITVASEVQQSANYNSTTGTTETVTITVGAGASVDLYATSDSVSLPSGSVSSSPAATWTQRDSVGNTSTLLKHYTADGLSAGSYVITITWASAVAYRAMLARQITGTSGYDLAASAAHSANYQSSLGSTAADAITSGLTSTLSTQPALISGFTSNISSPTVTPVAGTGFTTFGAVWPQTNNTAIAEHKRITSTTALAATFTSPVTATTYTTAAAVFREGIAISGTTSSSYTTGTLSAANNGTVYSVDCTTTNGTTTSASVYLFIIGESSGDGDKINSAWFR